MAFFANHDFKQIITDYLSRNEPADLSEYNSVGSYLNHGIKRDDVLPTEPSLSSIELYMNNTILHYIHEEGEEWDKSTRVNQEWIGEQYKKFLSSPKENTSIILTFSFRFLYEHYLSCGNDVDHELVDIINYIQKYYKKLSPESYDKYRYALDSMPMAIQKKLFDKTLLSRIANVESLHLKNTEMEAKIDKYDESWDKSLIEKTAKVKEQEEKLKSYQQEYNFVGLNNGFKKLSDDKKIALEAVNKTVSAWKLGSIIVPFLALIVIWISTAMGKFLPYYALIPFTTMFLLSLYYYRVALFEQKSLHAQLLQVDLRMSLCQFIQSYSEYSKEIKDNNGHSLDKFEDLIFSGLVANEDKLPATFDGMDQIGKLIQAIKK